MNQSQIYPNHTFFYLCFPLFLIETIVEPNQKQYPWFHQQFRRVPTIDQCYMDDPCCQYEADMQFKRDKFVDNEILNILRMRFEDCVAYETPDHEKCRPIYEYYLKAEDNWFSKCEFNRSIFDI